jgi:hypothetical protein
MGRFDYMLGWVFLFVCLHFVFVVVVFLLDNVRAIHSDN